MLGERVGVQHEENRGAGPGVTRAEVADLVVAVAPAVQRHLTGDLTGSH